jgi:hypothetical protein
MGFLYPKVSRRDLPVMLGFALVGAIVAGAYGAIHDQLTYSISPEYFTRLKFRQFSYADFGLPERLFVAEIGFLATWWVGLVAGWLLARVSVPNQSREVATRQVLAGSSMVLAAALIAGGVGYALGRPSGADADYTAWRPLGSQLGIAELEDFVHVAYIHIAGYVGGLVGLVAALAYAYGERRARLRRAA